MTDIHGTPLRPGDIVLVENGALDLREYGVIRRGSDGPESPDNSDGPDALTIAWLSRPYLILFSIKRYRAQSLGNAVFSKRVQSSF